MVSLDLLIPIAALALWLITLAIREELGWASAAAAAITVCYWTGAAFLFLVRAGGECIDLDATARAACNSKLNLNGVIIIVATVFVWVIGKRLLTTRASS